MIVVERIRAGAPGIDCDSDHDDHEGGGLSRVTDDLPGEGGPISSRVLAAHVMRVSGRYGGGGLKSRSLVTRRALSKGPVSRCLMRTVCLPAVRPFCQTRRHIQVSCTPVDQPL